MCSIIRVIHTLSPKVGGLVSCFGLPRLVGPKVGRLVSRVRVRVREGVSKNRVLTKALMWCM